jgi:hypothetical protein
MVATPLTLVMDIKDHDNFEKLKAWIETMDKAPPAENKIRLAMDSLKLVHFARFVFFGEDKLAVITTFDGSFEDYIDAFAREIGPVFDKLLSHLKDAPPLPVKEHEEEFLAYARTHNIKASSFYSAYPNLSAAQIVKLQPKPAEGNAPK